MTNSLTLQAGSTTWMDLSMDGGVPEVSFNDITLELKAQTDKLQQALTIDLPRFNQMAQKLGLESVKEK